MRKFKLIKEYPASPKLGTIITIGNDGYLTWKDTLTNGFISIHNSGLAEYKEFWEEIVEKDYEILAYKTLDTNRIYLLKDGIYISDNGWSLSNPISSHTNIIIHSIKRLSDDEVFTIGDKINNGYVISQIKYFENKKNIWLDLTGKGCYGGYHSINDIVKDKKPLFTTEDGVDIFEDDECYILEEFGKIAKYKHKNFYNSATKFFSTKEKAEEYIKMNKPKFSINDIISIINEKKRINTDNFIQKLKDM